MNLSIFSFNKQTKIYASLFLVFYICFIASFLIFSIKPSIFYWRAWEYFTDIVFHMPSNRSWVGPELGDGSRKYLFSFQNKRNTIVTCDEDGFRSVPLSAQSYPITVFGDSHIWGSGLSDSETIPWILGEILHVPIFNAGRGAFQILKDLSYPKISKSKIVIEIMAEHLLEEKHYSFQEMKIGSHDPIIKDSIWSNILSIHPKRYFILSKLVKFLDPYYWMNEALAFQRDNYLTINNKVERMEISEDHLRKVLDHIKKKSDFLKENGYIYIFAMTPSKTLVLAHKQDETDHLREKKIDHFFKKHDVHYIDMCDLFRNAPNPKELYQPTDSHISPIGTKLMANALAKYILILDQNSAILENFL